MRDERKTPSSQKNTQRWCVLGSTIRDSNSTLCGFFDLPPFIASSHSFRVLSKEGTFGPLGKRHYKSARERVLASSAEELAKNNTSQHSWRVAMVPPDRSRAACAPFRRDVSRRQSALCRRRRCTTTCIAPRRFQSMRAKRRSSRGGRRTRRRKRSPQNDEENNNTALSRATR